MPMLSFAARSFAVPFFLEEEFGMKSLKALPYLQRCVEGHAGVVFPVVMSSEEVSRESSLWADGSRDLLP